MKTQIERNCIINTEFSEESLDFWFNYKQKKFLHNIDTFYYSVSLYNDFLKTTEDKFVISLRSYFNNIRSQVDGGFDVVYPLSFPGTDEILNFRNAAIYSRFYSNFIECPEEFDIYIADSVPTEITPQIIVQLRSSSLWLHGAIKAFERSYECVKAICRFFHLQISEVKENRIDYCWHTNYIQRPDVFFEPHNFAKMEVSRFKRVLFQYQLKKMDNEIESDYIAMGSRGDKCFVRIYLKSKEVIEMGYKDYFLTLWLFQGLISRYDYEVYKNTYISGKWINLDSFRLQYYLDYGSNDFYKQQCRELLNAENPNRSAITKLANVLTPPVTLVVNVEFQTTRKSTKSYKLIRLKNNEKYKEAQQIYDFLDNRKMITDYLTHSTLRLVDIDDNPVKARCDYVDFWKRLRNTKQVDVKLSKHQLKLVRDYSRELNKNVVKTKMCNSIVNFAIYCKGINQDDIEEDVLASILRLNDNDIHRMKNYKYKRNRLLKHEDFSGTIDNVDISNVCFLNMDTGESIW